MSSGGYANRLSEYPDKGVCGLVESYETKRSLHTKLTQLTDLVRNAKHIVVLTGAGVSTSAGIPDFRGPNGIWTKEEREKKRSKKKKGRAGKKKGTSTKNDQKDGAAAASVANGSSSAADIAASTSAIDAPPAQDKGAGNEDETKISAFYNSPARGACKRKRSEDESSAEAAAAEQAIGTSDVKTKAEESSKKEDEKSAGPSFETAKPTLTHRALTKLAERDIVKYVVTQNVDGLHRRSGLPRSKHAVLHGCVFTEKCEDCGHEYFRDVDLGGVSFQKTGRSCTQPNCGGDLRDTILDWDDALPEDDWERSQDEAEAADLILALGTSLRIEPAGSLPLRAKKFVIVNLQVTPLDGDATLIIREKVDQVMEHLLNELNIPLMEED